MELAAELTFIDVECVELMAIPGESWTFSYLCMKSIWGGVAATSEFDVGKTAETTPALKLCESYQRP